MHRIIPSTGEKIPVIGLGTWKTFDVNGETAKRPLRQVLDCMHNMGCSFIDSSPMYGHAESVIGELTRNMPSRDAFFYATKVWIEGRNAGIRQMTESFDRMGRTTVDLMQIHNLMDWKTQLNTLKDWKSQGKVRYIGVTHYTDAMHDELEKIITSETIDFVQFNYSIFSRNAEKRLLNTAQDRGVATLINRPFGEGAHFLKIKHKPLPPWAEEYAVRSWSQYFLLYLISHPAVTVVIPATANPAHAAENFAIATAELTDERVRAKMIAYLSGL